ncbi:hypothetical protein PHLGIDRAFT_319891 [Phlebiopsis gigantea 11061_1 CR5-6]|uniref:Polyketide synthase phosphopantetheine-binding domain-containing protein n=1 Tax=Phlebiopsis gigantea (strain 11061_1 CR5-6) TaxID=745531 RepID=A0A0C3PAT3_PHLG1|nr:hypothetical protein PHLGIDRAFT_319891 [Phlebiopsis gigantea 11061_1 CR5-6]
MESQTFNPDSLKIVPLPALPNTQGLSSSTFCQPPLDGTLAISEMWDWHAEHSPEHPVFMHSDDDGSISTLYWPEARRALHRAGCLVKNFVVAHPTTRSRKPIVSILTSSDTITYTTVMLGVQRAGFVSFAISSRNSPAAVAHLLTTTSSEYILIGRDQNLQDLLSAAFQLMQDANTPLPFKMPIPIFEDLFVEGATDFVPLPPLNADWDEPMVMMHSSGTTAFPKPITWTHYRQINVGRIPYYGEQDLTGVKFACHSLAIFHAIGIIQTCFSASVGNIMTAFKPQSPARVPAPDIMIDAVRITKSEVLLCVPSFVEEWSKSPESVEVLRQTKGVFYGGGPLAKEAGDLLRDAGVQIFTMYGTSEYGVMNLILPNKAHHDWEYFSLPKPLKARLMPFDEEGHVQLVLLPSEYQVPSVLNVVIDGIPGYDTNDVLAPHPTDPGFYKLFGRADEQIMHSTGEKTNPVPLEAILNLDPRIQCAVMFGRGKFTTGVIVEPKPEFRFDPVDHAKLAEFKSLIWPTVEKMNSYAPQHSRLFKEMVMVVSPSKPFVYTAKGTPRRVAIINDYADEIEALYAAADEATEDDLSPPSNWSYDAAKEFIRAVVTRVLEHSVNDNDDIFQHGCDSLEATWIRNSVVHALRETTEVNPRTIPGNFVYQNPTVDSLASFVSGLASSNGQEGSAQDQAVAFMRSMVEKYTHDLPKHVPSSPAPTEEVILVSGTTGSLGSSLLDQLIKMPSVRKVYAFNRKSRTPLAERQREGLEERGYDADGILGSEKLSLVETTMEDEKLGLPTELYNEIRTSVTHIIHNAWPVNFNLSLRSFEPSVRGVRHLIDLALGSPHPVPPQIVFVSSIGVFRDIDVSKPVVERPLDAKVAAGSGYSESKWVSESILSIATKEAGVPTVSTRVGQMTGAVSGAWNAQEWFPSLLKSSIHLGCVPTLDKTISWIPVDAAATAFIEMRTSKSSTLHLAHPRPVAWSAVVEPLATEFNLAQVSYDEWMARLEKSGRGLSAESEVAMMRHNPALKIFDFFKDAQNGIDRSPEAMALPQMDVTEAQVSAPSLRTLPQLSGRDAMNWVAYWRKLGFLA